MGARNGAMLGALISAPLGALVEGVVGDGDDDGASFVSSLTLETLKRKRAAVGAVGRCVGAKVAGCAVGLVVGGGVGPPVLLVPVVLDTLSKSSVKPPLSF